MDQKQQHHGGSGFLFGVVVGAAVTLLFTTKKGREIFKNLTEEGVSKVKDKLQETREQFGDFEDLEEAEDYLEPEERPEPVSAKKEAKSETKHETSHSPKRKFFRRS